MGNFYGQVMYEFTKMFSKFMVIKNANSDTPITPPDNPTDKFFEATTMWEQFNIEPTNRWIQLDGEGGNSDIKTIKIGHGTPGTVDATKTAIALEKIEEMPDGIEDNPLQLENGDIIKVATLTHDAAGHVTTNNNPSYIYYKLPTAQLIVVPPDETDEDSPESITPNDNDILQTKGDGKWITLTNDDNTLKIAHTTIASEEDMLTKDLTSLDCLSPTDQLTVDNYLEMMSTEGKTEDEINAMTQTLSSLQDIEIIALEGGDLIKAHQSEADDNGHIIKNTPIYYKLPTTPSQISFDIHEERITDLENRLKGDGTTYGDYEEIVDRVYKVGEWEEMYNQPAHQDITVTETIGKIDGENSVTAAINRLTGNTDDIITISTAIQKLVEKIRTQDVIIALIADKLGISLS